MQLEWNKRHAVILPLWSSSERSLFLER